MEQLKLLKSTKMLRLRVGYFNEIDTSKGHIEVLNSDDFTDVEVPLKCINMPFDNNNPDSYCKNYEDTILEFKKMYNVSEEMVKIVNGKGEEVPKDEL